MNAATSPEIKSALARFRSAAELMLSEPNSPQAMASAWQRYSELCSLAPSMTVNSEAGFKRALAFEEARKEALSHTV